MRFFFSLFALVVFGPALASRCVHAATVVVETTDGRRLVGAVDARSDDQRLWVRREDRGIVLAASANWDFIVSAMLDGELIDVAELRQRRAELVTTKLESNAQPAAPMVAPPAPTIPVRTSPMRSLAIVDACLVNLDRDVEPDGLTVSIAALDGRGLTMPVRGTLAAKLFGELRPNNAPLVAFGELDSWSQRVSRADFVDGVATYELRFRKTAPEFQFDLLPDALLDVSLGANGEGHFAAAAPVVLRPLNPLRDNMQLYEHTRFTPRELHGRNPTSQLRTPDGLWLNWPFY